MCGIVWEIGFPTVVHVILPEGHVVFELCKLMCARKGSFLRGTLQPVFDPSLTLVDFGIRMASGLMRDLFVSPCHSVLG